MVFKVIDSIIWREDAISRFESAIAIQQRFCALNLVDWEDFFVFAEDVGAISKNTKLWRPGKDFVRLDMERLDSVLGGAGTLQNSNFGKYHPSILPDLASEIKVFRYCPACIATGFHSAVHQLEWLSRCLIHGDLLSSQCQQCHQELTFDPHRRSPPLKNYCCIRCGYMFWSGVIENTWPVAKSVEELLPIKQYLRWIKSWNSRRQLAIGKGAFDFDRPMNRQSQIDELQSVLWSVPNVIKKAWRQVPSPKTKLLRLAIGKAKSNEIVSAFSKFGTERILAHSVVECGYMLSIEDGLWYFARHLRRRHRYCTKIVRREISSTRQDRIDWFNPRTHCHGYLASHVFRYISSLPRSRTSFQRSWPTRGIDPEFSAITEALVAGGLLTKRSLIAHIPRRYVGNLSPSFHLLDEDLRRVIRFIFAEIIAQRVTWFGDKLTKVDGIENLLDRDLAMRRLLAADFRDAGVKFLIYRQSRELVVASVRSSCEAFPESCLEDCDLEHRREVGNRSWVFRSMVKAEKETLLMRMKDALSKLSEDYERRSQARLASTSTG